MDRFFFVPIPAPAKAREVEFEVLGKNAPEARSGVAGGDPFVALLARLMDTVFVIPGTKIRFGLDPLIGLLPGFGAAASAGISLLMIALSAGRGVPRPVLARMGINVLINTVLDSVPIVGDALSIFYRSNAKNYALLQKHAGTRRKSTVGDWAFIVALVLAVIAVIVCIIVGAVTVAKMLLIPK
jgi:hypothetical protein